METKLPFVSVIVSTYNREKELLNIIVQLKAQKYSNYEINIIDQTKSRTKYIQMYLKKNQQNINYHKLDRANLCYARNYGINISKGEIVLFVDDDVSIKNNFIYQHAKNYSNPLVVGVVGQVLDAKNPAPKDIPPKSKIYFFGKETVCLHSTKKDYISFGRGCNMSFRKNIFKEIEMFDENLSIKDELDIYMRIQKKGYKIIFEPKASLYHHEAKSGGVAEIKWRSNKQNLNKKIWKLSRDETIFHLKHFNIFTFIFFFFFLVLRYVFKWNFPHITGMLSSVKATIGGTVRGLKLYYKNYK